MNAKIAPRVLFAAAFVVLVAVNYRVLEQVTDNRQGKAEALLWLTERELPKVTWLQWENSAMELRLIWRTLGQAGKDADERMPLWLRGQKLEELGFTFADGRVAATANPKPSQEREVFLVLEYNGGAYHEALRRAEQTLAREEQTLRANPDDKQAQSARQRAKKDIRAEELSQSRLFAIDAGLDPGQLRTSYADSSRYLVLPGIVRLTYRSEGNRLWATGAIESIHAETIHVPLEHRQALERIVRSDDRSSRDGSPPRYAVELVVGSRYSPWIAAVRPLADPQEND
jgi:hypothetical protein